MTPLRPTVLLGLLLLSTGSFAGTLHVDANLTTGLNDGSTWADAFQGPDGLQAAMAVVVGGDQIFAAQGTYRPSSTGDRNVSFSLLTGVEIYGGFLGTETSPSQRPPFGSAPSILSGDLNGDDDTGGSNAENSYHLIRGNSTDATAVVDGFRITAGNANSTGNNNKGGGALTVSGASPTIRNCHFIANRCTFGGGAGYISGNAAPSYTDCIFEDNEGGSFGGAFDMAMAGSVRIDRCVFTGNSAARAGAIEVFSTTGVVISNCVLMNNTATGGGGGGGFWIGTGGNTEIRNCTVVRNVATNQAAGGLRNQGASPTVVNSIFWENEGAGGVQGPTNQVGGTTSVTYSIVMGGLAGVGNSSGNPRFLNTSGGNLRLRPNSAAIDAGDNSAVPVGITVDFDSAPRFFDELSVVDTGVGTAPIVDMGAFESQGPQFTAFCFGDGLGLACPCANSGGSGNGCANGSFPTCCNLAAGGTPSVTSDSFTLLATQSTPSSPGIFFQGDSQISGGLGMAFGDGLRCAGTNICRIQLVFANSLGSASSTISISARCAVTAGQTKRMQWWYRDNALSLCGSGFNVSNGIETTWMP